MRKRGLILPLRSFFWLWFVIFFLLIVTPFIRHRKLSKQCKEQFHPETLYADTPGSERVRPVLDNDEAMEMHLRLIHMAKRRIIVSTYQMVADEAGKDYLSALLCAAGRGVKVELLVNGISAFMDLRNDRYMQAFSAHENITFSVYNPVSFLRPWKLQAALHSKYVIVDESCYLLGGRNILNLFLGSYGEHFNKDSELLVYETGDIRGTSLEQLLDYHARTMAQPDVKPYRANEKAQSYRAWKHAKSCQTEKNRELHRTQEREQSYPVSKKVRSHGAEKHRQIVHAAYEELTSRQESLEEKYPAAYTAYDFPASTLPTGKVSLLASQVEPVNKEPRIWYYLSEVAKGGKDISIYTPYIICDRQMYADLRALGASADTLKILTNAVENGANPFGCADYLNQKVNIQKTGAKVYEYSGAKSIHMKAWCVDDRMTMIGSCNMDMRSVYIDTELMLAVDSKELNRVIREDFNETLRGCRIMQRDGSCQYHEDYVRKPMPWNKRFIYSVLRGLTLIIRRFL